MAKAIFTPANGDPPQVIKYNATDSNAQVRQFDRIKKDSTACLCGRCHQKCLPIAPSEMLFVHSPKTRVYLRTHFLLCPSCLVDLRDHFLKAKHGGINRLFRWFRTNKVRPIRNKGTGVRQTLAGYPNPEVPKAGEAAGLVFVTRKTDLTLGTSRSPVQTSYIRDRKG